MTGTQGWNERKGGAKRAVSEGEGKVGQEQAEHKEKVDRRDRLSLSSASSSSSPASIISLPLSSLFVDDVNAVEDLVYAHLVEREPLDPEMSPSTRAGEREKGEKPK